MTITPENRKGMACQKCQSPMDSSDTRPKKHGPINAVRRKRKCPQCGHSIFTPEVPEFMVPNMSKSSIYSEILKRHPEVGETIKGLLG